MQKKRNVLNSPRLLELKKRRQKSSFNKSIIFTCGLIAIFIISVFISHFKSFNIVDVEINGNKILDATVLKNAVNDQMSGSYMWLFPKTNVMIYPQNAIKKNLQDKFKRIDTINVSLKENRTLSVTVTERTAKYTWCGVNMPTPLDPTSQNTNVEKCYFLDKDGFVFDEAPYFSGEVYFKFYGPLQNGEEILGNYFSKKSFSKLISFRDILINFKLKPISLYITPKKDMEIYLTSSTSLPLGPKILLKTDSDLKNAAENLEASLSTEPFKTDLKNKYTSLQYIDLRFKNHVYTKFK